MHIGRVSILDARVSELVGESSTDKEMIQRLRESADESECKVHMYVCVCVVCIYVCVYMYMQTYISLSCIYTEIRMYVRIRR